MKIKVYLLFWIFTAVLCAQNYRPTFEHISIGQGLFQSVVNCMVQDSRGFIWFGTNDGLARYDGYSSRVFRKNLSGNMSLPDNNITAIAEDNEGYIWIGTGNGYLCRYDPTIPEIKTYKILYHPLFTPRAEPVFNVPLIYAGLTNKSITSIFCDSTGSMWAGTFGSGLFRLTGREKKVIQYYYIEGENTISSDYIMSLAGGINGDIWIGTFGGGLNKISRSFKKGKETNIKFLSYSHKADSGINDVYHITSLAIKERIMWISSYDNGLYYFNLDTGKVNEKFYRKELLFPGWDNIGNKYLTNLAPGKNNNLWIGTYGAGLIQTDIKTGYSTLYEHRNNIVSLIVDMSGLVWTASLNGTGVDRFNYFKKYFEKYSPENLNSGKLSDNTVTTFAEDYEKNLWIGTLNGLNIYNKIKGTINCFYNDPDDPNTVAGNYITSLLVDNNKIWIGTFSSGLDLYDPVKKTFTHYRYNSKDGAGISSNRITSLSRDNKGAIWIGTADAGLNKAVIKDNNIQFIHYKASELYAGTLPDNNIRQILNDYDDKITVLTGSGYLCTYNENDDDFSYTKIKCQNYPDAEIVTCYFYDSLYIGTAANGLFKTDVHNSKPAVQVPVPVLKDKAIVSIIPYARELFLGTNFGLVRYYTEDNSVVLYNTNDELQGMKYSPGASLHTENGYLYFGGINGFNFFQPFVSGKYENKDYVFITSFKASDNEIPFTGNIVNLSEYQNSIQVEFSLTDYADPFKNQYLYKLSGYDKEWKHTTAGSHSAEYAGLPPGEYKLYVKGINSSGANTIKTAIVMFEISPVFWKTWWFILFVILLVLAGIAYFIYLRINHLLDVERLKSKLAADLHDSIGSGLTEIALLSDISQLEYVKLAGNKNTSLDNIAVRSRELVDNMSDIVWLVNPKPKSMNDLFIRLKEIYYPILSQQGMKFIVEIPESFAETKLTMDERQNIYLIFKEAINNSIKYSKAHSIYFTAEYEDKYAVINLKDDGEGFDVSPGIGNGIPNMKRRAANIKASFEILSTRGRGTSVTLKAKL